MIVHEDDQRIVELTNNGNTVMLTNKQSGVVGVMEIDADTVIFGSRSRMEMLHIQGNVVVSCFEDQPTGEDDEFEDAEDTD